MAFLYPINSLNIILLLLGLLCHLKSLHIGSGDFLFLSLFSFNHSLNVLLWPIQIASFLGLVYFGIQKKKELPFIPFLTIAYLIFQLFQSYLQ
ncbi:peptidase, A24A (type 4 prepilin peptidase 1) family protein [Streptococcus urinalis 2285-97]|uniref:Peptidase, A24A (Type 4 prepilin peptidase 1) family protein n=1 Tax=Streptococcus urinalis 2285-97 TaxID=764291 RepID=G5KD51_9STRE|nr:peptidase, A24A (type 4 prepilin peptidase 1) family protein [Streptococcus urinalis 2285-97]